MSDYDRTLLAAATLFCVWFVLITVATIGLMTLIGQWAMFFYAPLAGLGVAVYAITTWRRMPRQ